MPLMSPLHQASQVHHTSTQSASTNHVPIYHSCSVTVLMLQDNRGFAYAVLYAAMNVASLLSGWTLDLFRITFRQGFNIRSRSADSVLNSGYRLYLLLGAYQLELLLPS